MGHYFILIWVVTGLILGGLLINHESSQSQLNDPDPARERPGFLMSSFQAPALNSELPRKGKRTLLLFTRDIAGQELFHDSDTQTDISNVGDVILIVQNGSKPKRTAGLTAVLADRDGSIAASFQIRQPRDGGYPVGYVVIDSSNVVRYVTLDPDFSHQTTELRTIFEGVR